MATPFTRVEIQPTTEQRLRESTPTVSIWEPPVVQQARAATAPVVIPCEQQLIDTIAAPLRSTDTARIGHDRKEREIAALLAQLTPIQSLAVSKRLAINAPGDPLAAAFSRLMVERRNRLVTFLSNHRLKSGRR